MRLAQLYLQQQRDKQRRPLESVQPLAVQLPGEPPAVVPSKVGSVLDNLPRMIADFDRLLESGDDDATDALGKRIMCHEIRKLTGKPCGKK